MKKHRIWIKRKDKVKQRYWIGRIKKNQAVSFQSLKPIPDLGEDSSVEYEGNLNPQHFYDTGITIPREPKDIYGGGKEEDLIELNIVDDEKEQKPKPKPKPKPKSKKEAPKEEKEKSMLELEENQPLIAAMKKEGLAVTEDNLLLAKKRYVDYLMTNTGKNIDIKRLNQIAARDIVNAQRESTPEGKLTGVHLEQAKRFLSDRPMLKKMAVRFKRYNELKRQVARALQRQEDPTAIDWRSFLTHDKGIKESLEDERGTGGADTSAHEKADAYYNKPENVKRLKELAKQYNWLPKWTQVK